MVGHVPLFTLKTLPIFQRHHHFIMEDPLCVGLGISER